MRIIRTSKLLVALGTSCGYILGILFKLRVFPFLKAETIKSGGQEMPTSEFVNFGSRFMFIFSTICACGLLVWCLVDLMRRREGNAHIRNT
ncbi:MAG: hypothetical protein DME24_12925 [Verrucomicrobia bacterium]|nr:MAG: hypothetical protein DME24_12925 [Verrucomicrobiota bacterium]